MSICCLSTTSHGIICLIVTKIKLLIILRIVSELELQVGKNKNSRTQLGRKVLLVLLRPRNCCLVKKLDAFSFLTLHIERKMDLL
ncbi:hypothetical protein Gotur_032639 [Gossypium turneri]